MKTRSLLAALLTLMAATGALLVPATTAPASAEPDAYAQIEGTGSTWSQLIVEKWIADVDSAGMKVVYTGGGSSKGRKDFAQSTVDFAISEIPYQGTDENGNADTSNGRDFAYLPIVAGGTAFTYQLKIGGTLVRNLRLSGETIAKIFTNQITNWNDPAITRDNNGRSFPSLPITPVVRSDGSGTTAQFTTWLDDQYSSIWRPYFGRSGLTSYYPRKSGTRMVGQSGSDQVMNTIRASTGNGMIGYVEYSYPQSAGYPVVKVLNKGGYFVEPTQYNVAVALTNARINKDKGSTAYLTQDLRGVYTDKDPRTYPLSSYSYMILPTGRDDSRMTTSKRQTLADFMYYSLCTGQQEAGNYGYSPLPLNLVQAGFDQLAKLKKADPDVDLTDRDVTKCNNPTFVAGNLSRNHLAEVAPMPAACDKVGEGPCGTATGTGRPSTDEGGSGASGEGGTTSAGGGGGGSGGGGGGGAPAIDPETGQAVTDDAALAAEGTLTGSATLLSSERSADRQAFTWLAVAELLALVLVPGLLVAALRRRTPAGSPR